MDRVLLVKTSSLGDVIHNLPVVSDIHRHFPQVKIDWLVEENYGFIPHMHPQVNEVIPVALRRWRKKLFLSATWREIGALRKRLKSVQYDAVIDTQGLVKSALLAKWANGPSYGQDRQSAREPLAARFYNHALPISRSLHAVERNRMLAAQALGYPIPTDAGDYGTDLDDLARPGFIPEGDYVFVLHGTARASKRWPDAHWQQLFALLAERGLQVVAAWGSEDELALSKVFASHNEAVVVPPTRLNVIESAQAILHAKAVIGVDTGFSHLAAALGIPVIGIYTDTDPTLSGVHGSGKAAAINVGNVNQVPTVDEVMTVFSKLEQG
jgi:heptosyltransferase-1